MDPVNAYCELEELKLAVGPIPDTNDDVVLQLAIEAASREIDDYCGQRFWLDVDVVARAYFVTQPLYGSFDLLDGDVVGIGDLTGLVVKIDGDGDGVFEQTLVANTDFVMLPLNAAASLPLRPFTSLGVGLLGSAFRSLPWSFGRPTLQVTGKWGWPAIPAQVKQACILQAAQLWKSKDAVFGVASWGEFGPMRVKSAMNPIAEGLLSPFRQIAIA